PFADADVFAVNARRQLRVLHRGPHVGHFLLGVNNGLVLRFLIRVQHVYENAEPDCGEDEEDQGDDYRKARLFGLTGGLGHWHTSFVPRKPKWRMWGAFGVTLL